MLTKKQIAEVYRTARGLRKQRLKYREVASLMNELGYKTKYGHRFTTNGAYHVLNTAKYTSHLRD